MLTGFDEVLDSTPAAQSSGQPHSSAPSQPERSAPRLSAAVAPFPRLRRRTWRGEGKREMILNQLWHRVVGYELEKAHFHKRERLYSKRKNGFLTDLAPAFCLKTSGIYTEQLKYSLRLWGVGERGHLWGTLRWRHIGSPYVGISSHYFESLWHKYFNVYYGFSLHEKKNKI